MLCSRTPDTWDTTDTSDTFDTLDTFDLPVRGIGAQSLFVSGDMVESPYWRGDLVGGWVGEE